MGYFERQADGRIVYHNETGVAEVVMYAVAVDAGDNELGRVPARHWQTLGSKYGRAIREGRIALVGRK